MGKSILTNHSRNSLHSQTRAAAPSKRNDAGVSEQYLLLFGHKLALDRAPATSRRPRDARPGLHELVLCNCDDV